MKLLFAPPSPYARKVRVTILEKGLGQCVQLTAVSPLEDDPALLAVNPLCKVPALVCDDGSVLTDSALICEYLDSLVPECPLYPAAVPDRFAMLRNAYLANGVLDAAVTARLEQFRPQEKRWTTWRERQQRAIRLGLDALEARIDGYGATLSYAHITTGVMLEYLDFRLPELAWREGRGQLSAWQAEFARRPAMGQTAPA